MAKEHKDIETSSLNLETFPRKYIPCYTGQTEEETGRNTAELLTSPAMAALRIVNAVDGVAMADTLDIPTLLEEFQHHEKTVNNGDLTKVEAMLVSQATALQTLFSRLAERAIEHNNIASFDVNMKMALRAQSQCRATLETLAGIKNPPIIYANQTNIAQGYQQVNNGIPNPSDRSSSYEEKIITSNELFMEPHNGKWLDTGTKSKTGNADNAVATLDTLHRAENCKRKSKVSK